MKLKTDDTIDTALRHYAVLLNRPSWLDPGRLEVQRDVWLSLIHRLGGDREGAVTIDDFDSAILTGLSGRDVHEVVPARIIAEAVGYAALRAEAAQEVMRLAPELRIYDEQVRLSRITGRAADVADVDAAVSAFWVAIGAKIKVLETSGYPRSVIDPLIEAINLQAEDLVTDTVRAVTARREARPPSIQG